MSGGRLEFKIGLFVIVLLAMAAVDQWSASLLKLDYPEKVGEHWNPHEPSQLFWLDDTPHQGVRS